MRLLAIHVISLALAANALADNRADDSKKPESSKAESKELKARKAMVEKCRKLFEEGKEDEAVALGMKSVDLLVAGNPKLPFVTIGSIITEDHIVAVRINLRAGERAKKKPPITRPYSFAVYSVGKKREYLYSLDFEHGHDDGVLATVALGRMVEATHLNYGVFDLKVKFSEVKTRAMEIIKGGAK